MKVSLKMFKKNKQEELIPFFFYKEALSETLCLFNDNCVCNMADGKWGCRGMPIACWTVIGENIDLITQTCSDTLVKTLSNTYFLWFSSVLHLYKHRKVSCPMIESCICPSIPSSPASFFVIIFFPLLFYLKTKHLRLRFWIVTCLVTIVTEGILPFYLVTFLPNWTWESFRNTLSYSLL